MLCHWRFGSPVVATVHHLSSISYRNQALGAAERALAALGIRRGHTDWIFRQIARHGTLVAVSNFVRQCLILDKIPAERVQVIYNGTPFADEELPLPDPTARNEFNLPSDAVVLGVVGHICPSKGQLLAVQALGELPDQLREKVRLLLIGRLDRQFAPLLKGAIEQLGLSDRVILTGERRDIQRLVSILDLLIHPSQAEACPISVIEALALGKPVIATRVGGLSEVVTHETDGLLIEPTVQALTSAILFLADNSAERSRMGALARQHAIELFSSETMVSRYEALYRQLLNSEKGIS
jgi:glycosyltransferase involved in cell wall biosynthesis